MADPAPPPSFTVDGNRLTMLTEGPERMERLLELIGSAQRTLRVLYYIYVADEAGEAVRDAGVELCRFVPRWGRRYLLRNHQKLALADEERSEERRGGKGCRSRWSPYHSKK